MNSKLKCLYILFLLTIMPLSASAGTVKVFLLGGASNMWGQGFASEVPPPYDAPQEDVWIWQDDLGENVGWTDLRPGFGITDSNLGSAGDHEYCNSTTEERGTCVDRVGPELTFGRVLADAFPNDQIAIIKHARGGRELYTHWNAENTGPPDIDHMYSGLTEKVENATNALRDAGLTYEISGMVFYTANDARNNSGTGIEVQTYGANLTNLIASVREDFSSNPTMPFVVVRPPLYDPENIGPLLDELRGSLEDVAAADPWVGIINTDDVSRRPVNEMYLGDSYHYDTAGQLELGRRYANAYLTLVSVPSVKGDFNGNGVLDAGDVDMLAGDVPDPSLDLTSDGIVNQDDRVFWVHDLAHTYFGDANLDGEFNSGDLTTVLAAGEYDDDINGNSGWAEGDWDGDGEFTSADVVVALADGGFGQGPRTATAAVPEPSSAVLLCIGLLAIVRRRR